MILTKIEGSVRLEDANDIIADLEQGLAKL